MPSELYSMKIGVQKAPVGLVRATVTAIKVSDNFVGLSLSCISSALQALYGSYKTLETLDWTGRVVLGLEAIPGRTRDKAC